MMTDKPQGFLDKLGDVAAKKILPRLVELLWPKMQDFLAKEVDKLWDKMKDFLEKEVLPKVLATIPAAVASAVSAVVADIPGVNLVKPIEAVADSVLDDIKRVTGIDIPNIFGGMQ